MRIIIILISGILSYLFVFLLGYFLFVSGEDKFFKEKKIPINLDKKLEKLPLKNPGKEPPPK